MAVAAPGLTTRAYFRQLRRADFEATIAHALQPDDGRKTLFDVQREVDKVTDAHYEEPEWLPRFALIYGNRPRAGP